MNIQIKKSKGVVWVEFLIVSSTVLLSMLYLIPMLAKYMDLRHSAEQAARYGAWERTVWHGKVGKYGGHQIKRSSAAFQNEAVHRVLSNNSLVYSNQGKDSEMSAFKMSTFHGYNNLPNNSYEKLIKKKNGRYLNLSETVNNGKFSGAPKLDTAFSALNVLLEKKLPVNTKGYYKNKVTIDAHIPSWIDGFGTNNFPNHKIAFTASNSILTDSWGAGGNEDNKDKILGLRPKLSSTVRKTQLKFMKFSFALYPWFSKEIRGDNIKIDKVHIDQLLDGEDPDDASSHVERVH